MSITITGFCWSCGLQCKGLFCDEKCDSRYQQAHKHDNDVEVMKKPRWVRIADAKARGEDTTKLRHKWWKE